MKQNKNDQENKKIIHSAEGGEVTVVDFKSFLENVHKQEENGEETLKNLEKRIPNLILDFKDIEYISSSGLRPIISIKKIIRTFVSSMHPKLCIISLR